MEVLLLTVKLLSVCVFVDMPFAVEAFVHLFLRPVDEPFEWQQPQFEGSKDYFVNLHAVPPVGMLIVGVGGCSAF